MPPRGGDIRVLNVAEKPSVAREITRQLGGPGAVRQDGHGMHVSEFPFTLMQTACRMTVTAVRGHLKEYKFPDAYKSWKAQSPAQLFGAPLERIVTPDCQDLGRTLQQLSRQSDWLVLWLDCDREGEAIAFEVMEVCQQAAGGRLRVFRAVFSALTRTDLIQACSTLRPPDQRLALAVEARQEIDLRIGSAFTRWMSLRYQAKFPELSAQVLSYGPCQFPTLGFVVERFLRIQRFVPEPFWSIRIEAQKDGQLVPFSWRRGRIFDRLAVFALYELCLDALPGDGVRVTRISEDPKTRWRPLPLNTVELTKLAATKLRIAPARCMHLAEELYQRGFISYPRTETDRFQCTIDVHGLIQQQTASTVWGNHARSLVEGDRFTAPRSGPHNDNAHPPIHPVQCAELAQLGGESWRVYELVTRHFLACCSPDARGSRTEVEAVVAGEMFSAVGLIILDRGWLAVYPYSVWSDTFLPRFTLNERLVISVMEMTESRTQPPPLLSEADLISMMDRTGIGTDATMHDHIQKIQTRNYAVKNDQSTLTPTSLGIALIEGYKRFALEEGLDLSKPHLRAQMESGMTEIARGLRSRDEFLAWCLDRTKRCYVALERNAPAMDAALGQHFADHSNTARAAPITQAALSACRCGARMDVRCAQIGQGDAAPAPPQGGGRGGGRGGRGGRAGRGGRLARSAGPFGRGGRAVRGARGGRGGGRVGRGRARSAPPGSVAGAPPRRRQERFLVCSNAACGVVLPVPSRETQTLRPFGHMCPICGFQVLTVRDELTGREHQLCPWCFTNVPHDLHPGVSELRCFRCAHPGCPLAGGQARGAGDPSGGGGGSGGGFRFGGCCGGRHAGSAVGVGMEEGTAPAPRLPGETVPSESVPPPSSLFACIPCAGQGYIKLKQVEGGRWCIQCSRAHPGGLAGGQVLTDRACPQPGTVWLPPRVSAVEIAGQCLVCSQRLRCEVRTLTILLSPQDRELADVGHETLHGVCVAGCNDVLANMGA
eukprot:TRINITY_DN43132_c0_g1_i1.p1 TRINITY_DN43132_c0_g1~~TRINITY_DN43132_c0_g1_i1.p1  ORF type:complete len:1021 (+),score=115.04 TRINITY_DN43132_c0_g1_i1:71-3064(+)